MPYAHCKGTGISNDWIACKFDAASFKIGRCKMLIMLIALLYMISYYGIGHFDLFVKEAGECESFHVRCCYMKFNLQQF